MIKTLFSVIFCWLICLQVSATERARLAIWPVDSQIYGQEMDLDTKMMIENIVPDLMMAKFSSLPIKIVERQQLLEILNEQKLSSSELASEDTRIRLGKLLGAQYMFFGTYIKIGSQAQMEGRIVDTQTSQIVASEVVEQNEMDLLMVAEELGQNLSSDLMSKIN